MNKSEIKSEAEEFLREVRELVEQERVFFVPREENRRWIRELDLITEQAWELIGRLTINNYCAGPEEDRDRSMTFLWKFGCTVDKQETYIKLKIEETLKGRLLKCLSFHAALFALEYPLRPKPHEKGE